MWLAARITVVLAALYTRWRLRRRVVQPSGRQWGVAYSVVRERRGKESHTTIGVPLESRVLFRIAREDRVSKWFDKLGLTAEMRTGQPEFDKALRSVAEHKHFGIVLRKEKTLRAALLAFFEAGAHSIYCDGRVLWVRFPDTIEAEKHFPELVGLKRMMASLEKPIPSRFADLTLWRAILVEAVLFAVFFYAVLCAALEGLGDRSVYLSPWSIVPGALVIGLALSAAMLAVTYVLTLKAPRAESLRQEALAMCFFVLPLGGFGVASQLNRLLDGSAPVVASAEVALKEKSKGGGKFFLHLKKTRGPASLSAEVPSRVEVSATSFQRVKPGSKIKVSVGRGRLGAEYIRAVRLPAVAVTPKPTPPPTPTPTPSEATPVAAP